jgi:hypothetical protein
MDERNKKDALILDVTAHMIKTALSAAVLYAPIILFMLLLAIKLIKEGEFRADTFNAAAFFLPSLVGAAFSAMSVTHALKVRDCLRDSNRAGAAEWSIKARKCLKISLIIGTIYILLLALLVGAIFLIGSAM